MSAAVFHNRAEQQPTPVAEGADRSGESGVAEAPRSRCWLFDGFLVLCIMAAAVAVALPYLNRYVTTIASSYKVSTRWFGPSLMLASGKGFVNPVEDEIPGLRAFLDEETPDFDASRIPEGPCFREPSGLHKCYRYLLYAVALTWRIGGVSWGSYKVFLAVLYAVLAAVVYGLFRLGMGRLLSLAGTAAFMLSPVVLTLVPSSRDFAKAPFILGVVLVIGYLVSRPVARKWRYFAACAALGALIGVGLGFRDDLLVCLIPAALAILLVDRGPAALRVVHRLEGVGLFGVCFIVFAGPILIQMEEEGPRASHHIINGMSREREADMGIVPASYERVYLFSDAYVHATANSYGHRVLGITEEIPYLSPNSSLSGTAYVLDVFRQFPADMITRGLASTSCILGGGFLRLPPGEYPTNDFVKAWAAREHPLAAHLERWKVFYVAAGLLMLGSVSFRLGWSALLLMLYFTGYACLQFHVRHCFHLTFISLWLFGFVIARGLAAVWRLRLAPVRRQAAAVLSSPRCWWAPPVKRVVSFAASVVLVFTLVFGTASLYQRHNVKDYLARCAAAELEPVATHLSSSETSVMFALDDEILSPRVTTGGQVWEVQTEYLAAVFAASAAPRMIRIEYDSECPFNDFSCNVLVAGDGAARGALTRYFFPVYQSLYTTIAGTENPYQGFDGRWGRSALKGISMPIEYGGDFKGLYRVKDIMPFRVLLNLSTSDDNSRFRYQQWFRLQAEGE